MSTTLQDRFVKTLLGAAVGDALGVPHEFSERELFYISPVIGMCFDGTHRQPMGTWSDDTAMIWATVDVLTQHLKSGGGLPSESLYKNMILAFLEWFQKAKYTPHGEVFDIGNTVSGVLRDYAITPDFARQPLVLQGAEDNWSQGNGSLMRFLPVALWHAVAPWSRADLAKCSAITHAHPAVVDACLHYADVFRFALHYDFEKAIQLASHCAKKRKASYVPELKVIQARKEYEVYSTGYVKHTLEAAYWCILAGGSYQDCVLRAVNLGGDTDTIASITGGLCAWLGHVPPTEWLDCLARIKTLESAYRAYGRCLQKVFKQIMMS